MKRPIKSKKQTISDLEHSLVHLYVNSKCPVAHYAAIGIYNVLLFHFGVSKKKLDTMIVKS